MTRKTKRAKCKICGKIFGASGMPNHLKKHKNEDLNDIEYHTSVINNLKGEEEDKKDDQINRLTTERNYQRRLISSLLELISVLEDAPKF